MKINQNDLERITDHVDRGLMTAAQANFEKVRMQRVLLVTGRLISDVRTALNQAVKAGQLAHMKKDGAKPEAYYHPTFKFLANEARREHEESVRLALRRVVVL